MKISSIVKQNTTEITLQQENYSSYIVHLAQDKIHIGLRVYLWKWNVTVALRVAVHEKTFYFLGKAKCRVKW